MCCPFQKRDSHWYSWTSIRSLTFITYRQFTKLWRPYLYIPTTLKGYKSEGILLVIERNSKLWWKFYLDFFLSSLCHYLSWRDSDNIYLIYISLLFETQYGIYNILSFDFFLPHSLLRKIGLRDNYRWKISQWASVAGSGLKHFST